MTEPVPAAPVPASGARFAGRTAVVTGAGAGIVRADVADERDWTAIRQAAHAFGPVHLLVSNAGLTPPA
jgi:glucose 1-dehydrogenase